MRAVQVIIGERQVMVSGEAVLAVSMETLEDAAMVAPKITEAIERLGLNEKIAQRVAQAKKPELRSKDVRLRVLVTKNGQLNVALVGKDLALRDTVEELEQ